MARKGWTTITVRRETRKRLERAAGKLAAKIGVPKVSMDFMINYLLSRFEEEDQGGPQ